MESKVFINHTHHNSQNWSPAQLQAAEDYGTVVDIPSPDIEASWDEQQVVALAEEYAEKIVALHPAGVLCQGEFTYTYAVVQRLQKAGIPVMAACSKRQVEEITDKEGNTKRMSLFQFIRFRRYEKV
jgi:hypothetical protein